MKHLKIKRLLLWLVVLSVFLDCGCVAKSSSTGGVKNPYRDYPVFSDTENVVNCVIEISAGDKEKWELNLKTGNLELPLENGKPKINKYAIPYPFNYGMIPQTLVLEEDGGDGDPVDIVILGKRLERLSLQHARVLGILHILDKGRIDNKVLGVVNEDDDFAGINSLEDLETRFPQVLEIVKIWFNNYKLNDAMQVGDFSGPPEALRFINAAGRDFRKKEFNNQAKEAPGGN